MNFFKLYIGDYQRDTAHLSITEHGAYLLMLQHYYATEKPLPVGKALHRMLRSQDKGERESIDSVAKQFWRTTSDGLVNDRADAEITKAGTQADTNARIAREREDARRHARKQHEPSTNRATNDQPNQTPDTRHQRNTSEPSGSGDKSPPTDRDMVFSNGVPLLTAAGVAEKNARSMLAGLCKKHSETAVLGALEQAAKDRPGEPVAWLQSLLAGKPRPNAQEALETQNREVGRRFLEKLDANP